MCNGKPELEWGLRITVHSVLSHLAVGDTPADILKSLPRPDRDDIKPALIMRPA